MSSVPFTLSRPARPISVALGAIAVATLLVACGKTEPEPVIQPSSQPATPTTVVPSPADETTVGTDLDDSVVTARVKSALARDDVVKGMDVSVETRKGQVVLSGFVDTGPQRERAAEIAQAAEGVSEVRNDLIVRQ